MTADSEKMIKREPLRVGLVLFAGGLIAALAMAVLLGVFANIDAHQPVTTDLTPGHVVGMTVFFCFFTVPIAVVLGAPLYLLLRRFDLLRVPVCTALGSVAGVLMPYAFRAGGADHVAMLWFGLSGAVAGAMMGLLLQSAATRRRVAVKQG